MNNKKKKLYKIRKKKNPHIYIFKKKNKKQEKIKFENIKCKKNVNIYNNR